MASVNASFCTTATLELIDAKVSVFSRAETLMVC